MELYHYTSINNLALILASRKIRFNRLDKVNDPTEGEASDFHNFSIYIFVSCWTNLKEENLALWNMYTPQMRGVRIELPMPIFTSHQIESDKNSLIPFEKLFNPNDRYFSSGGSTIPYAIEYTNDNDKLRPKILTPFGLNTSILGRYKHNIWDFENEYRFRMDIIPIDPNIKSEYFPAKYEQLISTRTPPPVDYYDIEINPESFSKMKILLGPKLLTGDFEIIKSLIKNYNPQAAFIKSNLSGLIK